MGEGEAVKPKYGYGALELLEKLDDLKRAQADNYLRLLGGFGVQRNEEGEVWVVTPIAGRILNGFFDHYEFYDRKRLDKLLNKR